MEKKTFTLADMRAAFLAGAAFESDYIAMNMDIETEFDGAPDYGVYMKDSYDIDVDKK